MSVLIKGMEMPQGNSTINVLIYADGTVYTGHVNDSRYSAVSVPTPHGDLVDRNELMTDVIDSDLDHLQRDDWEEVIQIVQDAPTIIEAEEEED